MAITSKPVGKHSIGSVVTADNAVTEKDSVAGIYAVSLGLFAFSIQDVIIRSLSDTHSALQIVFTRSIVALLILSTILMFHRELSKLRVHKLWPLVFKGACAFVSYILYYMALTGLPLADAATITFIAPVLVTALSALLFGEVVGWRRWLAVLLGFLAMILVVGPKGHFGNLEVVFALGAAFTYAVSTIVTRYIDKRDEALTAAFYSIATFLALSTICSILVFAFGLGDSSTRPSLQFLLRDWHHPSQQDQWLMVLLGFIASCGFYLLVRAYMIADFSAVAPFEYLYIVWGAAFGFFIWNEVPSLTTAAGVALLVGSNLYILRREVKLKKRNAFRRPKIPHR